MNRKHFFIMKVNPLKYRVANRNPVIIKQTEDSLVESEERYRIAIEHSNDGVAIVKGCYHIFVNNKFLEIFGYNNRDEIIGNQIYITVHPDDREMVISINERRQRGEDVPSKYEFKGIKKDGTTVFIEVSAAGIIYRGEPATLAYLRDITEHKMMNDALKESERRYRDLVENALVGIYAADINGCISYINNTFSIMFGFDSREEMISIGLASRFKNHKDRRMFVKTLLKAGKLNNFELELLKKDGQTINVLLNATSKDNIISGMVLDITEHKLSEQLLRQSEEKYRNIFENAVEGIFQSTEDGRFLSVNPALAKMYGYGSPEEFIASITDIEKQLYVNPWERLIFKELLEKNGIIERFEIQVYKKNRSKFWISFNARAVKDSNGLILYYEGTVEDITSRKQAEEEKMRLEAQLRQSQRMEAIGQLAGGIAHDFNNVLIGIKGIAMRALKKTPSENPLYDKLELILKGAQRGHDLVKRILTFSRKGESNFKPVRVGQIIRETVRMMQVSVPPNIEISENILTKDDTVLADQIQIYQVVLNLCFNGVHAMEDKGGMLKVSLADESIDPSEHLQHPGLKKGDYLKITVSDTGRGMTPETIKRIFDPFFTTKRPEDGTGLGLSVVKSIVKEHNGLITVSSELSKGTSFCVYLSKHH
ncbi:MAG TPA: PAS domain S-box protein [Syntrophorhabdaceae bacterium]|nr:PAS domain S-box protein [Syntrophorhabdaceae bacterium]MDI9560508.1 PAS domain S-box protein [Pseudomonadota bacterium]HOG40405.1 PAS domain S-box protein [Syntrophorhabdaceae bacterium]HQG51457.1 PAS domain S-box protein [Syntrophorhabdaceae bacterium]HQJ94173.1 PAS domain S-box protein [Syntrophorhabdaceae bacterium]